MMLYRKTHTQTWRAATCVAASLASLLYISTAAVVETRWMETGIIFLTEDSSVAIIAITEESALHRTNARVVEL